MDNKDYFVVNAFTENPFEGNPAGVFPNADGLTDFDMQNIARQLNLVETAFVFSSDEDGVDKHLRYFTPLKELPVAGHPTIAAWGALAYQGIIDPTSKSEFKQRTAAGIQDIKILFEENRTLVQMKQPHVRFLSIVENQKRVANVFGINEGDFDTELPIQAIDSGLGHIVVPIKTIDALMKVERNIEELARLCKDFDAQEAQLFTFDAPGSNSDLHTRNICPRQGVEDPACGIGNGALGYYLAEYNNKTADKLSFVAKQGSIVKMPATIHIEVIKQSDNSTGVYVGGYSYVMMKGRMLFS